MIIKYKLKEKEENEKLEECAKRFWKNHQLRNDSIITDLFSGLLKNEFLCSECGYHKITFEPFNSLNLSIPNYNYLLNKIVKFIFILKKKHLLKIWLKK